MLRLLTLASVAGFAAAVNQCSDYTCLTGGVAGGDQEVSTQLFFSKHILSNNN